MQLHKPYTPTSNRQTSYGTIERKENVKVPIPWDLREDAIERGRKSRHIQFDSALNTEISDFGYKYIWYFIRGFMK